MTTKLVITKVGNQNDYLHLPLMNNDYTAPVGAVIDVNEIEEGYELTIALFNKNI